MTYPIHPTATLAHRAEKSFALLDILARPCAVALEIGVLIVLAIAAILAVLPRARAETGTVPVHVPPSKNRSPTKSRPYKRVKRCY